MKFPVRLIVRFVCLCLCAGFISGTAFAQAQTVGAPARPPGEIAPANPPAPIEENYTFAFQNADVRLVVGEILGQLDVPHRIEPTVSGQVSFRIEQKLNRDQLLAALEATLAAQGLAMVRNGEQLIVTPQAQARAAAGIRQDVEGVGRAGYEIVAVPLSYGVPSEIAAALEAVSASKTVLYFSDKLGLLLLGGSGEALKTSLETIKVFDQSAFKDSKIRWFELSQAQATVVGEELQTIIRGAGLVGVAVVPLKRLNGLLIFGRSPESLDELSKWVAKLDTPGKVTEASLWVYRPRHTSAESLATTLNTVLGLRGSAQAAAAAPSEPAPSTTAPTAAPVNSGAVVAAGEDVRVGVDKETNTLLIFASPQRWIQIQRILGEIDRQPRQIFIEASILEVALNKDFQFGVDWSAFNDHLKVSSINGSSSDVDGRSNGLSIVYLNVDIAAAIRTIGSRTRLEVISAPKLIALDNRTASLQIGDQVPIVVQSSQSTNASNAALINSVDYRSTGVILTVKPRVTGENQLILEVSQEVSSVSRTQTSGIDSPTILQRRFESALVLDSGQVVALGGLISSNRSDSNSGVPLLKDVPALGALFRTSGRSQSRTELIVLLSAKILGDRRAADQVVTDLKTDMEELQRRGMLPASQ